MREEGSTAVALEAEVTLTDGTVTLRPWRPDDAPAVFDACQDPLIARFLPIPRPYTAADARAFVEARRQDWSADDERSFAIVDAATDELLGAIARHGPVGHRATFGYWLAPQARGRGVATRALRLIADWTIATTEVIRLDLCTDLENDASGRVAERVGFEREGIRRAWDLDRAGRPIDVIFYVLVRDASGADRIAQAEAFSRPVARRGPGPPDSVRACRSRSPADRRGTWSASRGRTPNAHPGHRGRRRHGDHAGPAGHRSR